MNPLRHGLLLFLAFSLFFCCLAKKHKHHHKKTFPAASQQKTSIFINTSIAVGNLDDNFICATLDWWPPEKCDYGTCSWGRASLLNLDLTNKKFESAVKGLSPVLLRLGGSLQDQIVYNVGTNPGACLPLVKKESSMFGFTGGCLNMSRWKELNDFFIKTGSLVAFGLNALYGRNDTGHGFTGAWKSSNAEDLIQFTVDHGYQIVAWELGNELSGSGVGTNIEVKQYASDMKQLRSLVDKIYAETNSSLLNKPIVVAPDGFYDAGWFAKFLQLTGLNVVNAISHHIYNLGPGVDTHLVEKILDPSYLSQEAGTFSSLQNVIRNNGPWSQAWVGEAGGAYNSGHPNITDTFLFSFWYLDQLGMAAIYNTSVYCRQSLIGGNYGLLSTNFDLNPDYFAALLWKKFMGKVVFSATATTPNSTYLRTYAHCLKNSSGGLAVLVINLSNITQYQVSVSLPPSTGKRKSSERQEYHMNAPSNTTSGLSKVVLLNGTPLLAPTQSLEPSYADTTDLITIDPLSIVFATLPNADVDLCR